MSVATDDRSMSALPFMIRGLWPEQRLAAALVIGALEGCRAGCADDCRWLEACGATVLTLLAGDEADVLAGRLLALATNGQPLQLSFDTTASRKE